MLDFASVEPLEDPEADDLLDFASVEAAADGVALDELSLEPFGESDDEAAELSPLGLDEE